MLITRGGNGLVLISNTPNSSLPTRNKTKPGIQFSKKPDFPEHSKSRQFSFSLRISNPVLARTATALFGLGFTDAGYSGDWSRIGVISKETEELLKVAAFVVVPLCAFLAFSLDKEPED